jgi:peptidoglycan/xylan/chitin deacetylase (PgdA/CDA1 family)
METMVKTEKIIKPVGLFPFGLRWRLCLIPVLLPVVIASGCGSSRFPTRPHDDSSALRVSREFPDFIAVFAKAGDSFASLAETYLKDESKGWVIRDFNGLETLQPGQGLIIPLGSHATATGGLAGNGYQTVPVLAYHQFSESETDAMTVKASEFEKQMGFLKDKEFRIITLDQFFDFLNAKAWIPARSAVITIDDGWRSTYDIAFPILQKYGFPATLFVYTDLIGGGPSTLTWQMIQKMARHGIDIQCHSKSHRNFNEGVPGESITEYFQGIERELTDSARIIQTHVGKPVKYLAYPYGETNPLAVALLKRLGFKGAFTVQRESNPFFVDNYRIHRAMIYGTFDLNAFEKNLGVFADDALR